MDRPDRNKWSQKGLCATQGIDPEAYFETASSRRLSPICSECPVFELCREYAMVHEEYGMWAGTTRKERNRFRKSDEYEHLLYKAIKEDWLEPHAVAPVKVIEDLKFLASIQASPQTTERKIAAAPSSFDFPSFDSLPFFQWQSEPGDSSSDKMPHVGTQISGDLLSDLTAS